MRRLHPRPNMPTASTSSKLRTSRRAISLVVMEEDDQVDVVAVDEDEAQEDEEAEELANMVSNKEDIINKINKDTRTLTKPQLQEEDSTRSSSAPLPTPRSGTRIGTTAGRTVSMLIMRAQHALIRSRATSIGPRGTIHAMGA